MTIMFRKATSVRCILSTPKTRYLSTRATNVLAALDFPVALKDFNKSELPGVYGGEWSGSGEVLESRCPATGELLARVKGVSSFVIISANADIRPLGFATGAPTRDRSFA